jgi:heat shock protein HslJ
MLNPLSSRSPRAQGSRPVPARALALLLGGLALAPLSGLASLPTAIAQAPTPNTMRPLPLEGSTWQLTSWRANGQPRPLPPKAPITLSFDGQRLGGSTGCNSYGVDYQLQNSRLQLKGAIASTMMACVPEIATREQQYLTALSAPQVMLRQQGNRLSLRYVDGNETGVLVFTRQAPPANLQSTSWQLRSIRTNATTIASTQPPATLQFTADSIQGFGGCNQYRGGYQTQQNRLTVGEIASTKKACSPDQMRLEQTFLAGLSNVQRYEIDRAGNLRLFFQQANQSGVLTFAPTQPTQPIN